MSNQLQPQKAPQKMALSAVFATHEFQESIHNALNDAAREKRFVSSIIAASVTNPVLTECTPKSVLSTALIGESLGLLPSPQLGQYYFVPYENKVKGRDGRSIPLLDDAGKPVYKDGRQQFLTQKVAQFQLGYKGYIQLALRSGYYRKLVVLSIKEGELKRWDPLLEEIEVELIQDDEKREATPTVGYYAMFEYLNGFRKAIYWSKEKMLAHADRYSPAFSKDAVTNRRNPRYSKVSFADYEAGKVPESELWLYSSFWYKDFDGMAYKTMIRQLLSKWGMLSVELQVAFDKDIAVEETPDGTVIILDPTDPSEDDVIFPDSQDVPYTDIEASAAADAAAEGTSAPAAQAWATDGGEDQGLDDL